MPLNSVNTNVGAQVALQSLNVTTTQLQATEKRISTELPGCGCKRRWGRLRGGPACPCGRDPL